MLWEADAGTIGFMLCIGRVGQGEGRSWMRVWGYGVGGNACRSLGWSSSDAPESAHRHHTARVDANSGMEIDRTPATLAVTAIINVVVVTC